MKKDTTAKNIFPICLQDEITPEITEFLGNLKHGQRLIVADEEIDSLEVEICMEDGVLRFSDPKEENGIPSEDFSRWAGGDNKFLVGQFKVKGFVSCCDYGETILRYAPKPKGANKRWVETTVHYGKDKYSHNDIQTDMYRGVPALLDMEIDDLVNERDTLSRKITGLRKIQKRHCKEFPKKSPEGKK